MSVLNNTKYQSVIKLFSSFVGRSFILFFLWVDIKFWSSDNRKKPPLSDDWKKSKYSISLKQLNTSTHPLLSQKIELCVWAKVFWKSLFLITIWMSWLKTAQVPVLVLLSLFFLLWSSFNPSAVYSSKIKIPQKPSCQAPILSHLFVSFV